MQFPKKLNCQETALHQRRKLPRFRVGGTCRRIGLRLTHAREDTEKQVNNETYCRDLQGWVRTKQHSTATAFVIKFLPLSLPEILPSDLTTKMLPFLPECQRNNCHIFRSQINNSYLIQKKRRKNKTRKRSRRGCEETAGRINTI